MPGAQPNSSSPPSIASLPVSPSQNRDKIAFFALAIKRSNLACDGRTHLGNHSPKGVGQKGGEQWETVLSLNITR